MDFAIRRFCHPELDSGSVDSNNQMLKQVQHDKMVKDGGALTHVPHGHPELDSGSENKQITDPEPKVDARRG